MLKHAQRLDFSGVKEGVFGAASDRQVRFCCENAETSQAKLEKCSNEMFQWCRSKLEYGCKSSLATAQVKGRKFLGSEKRYGGMSCEEGIEIEGREKEYGGSCQDPGFLLKPANLKRRTHTDHPRNRNPELGLLLHVIVP